MVKWLQVRIDKEREDALERKAAELGISKSEYIRRFIDLNCVDDPERLKILVQEEAILLNKLLSRYLEAKAKKKIDAEKEAVLQGIDTSTKDSKAVMQKLFERIGADPSRVHELEQLKPIFVGDEFVLTCIDDLLGGLKLVKNAGQKTLSGIK